MGEGLHDAFKNSGSFPGVALIQQMEFFSSNAPLPIGYRPPMVTAYCGANADVGRVTRAEQPTTHPIKKAICCHLGRFLKLNFQPIFSFGKTKQAF